MSQDWYDDVRRFTKHFQMFHRSFPGPIPEHHQVFRMDLVLEECDELRQAVEEENLAEIADGIADLIYVAIGMAVTYGIDLRPVWDEVHRTNMLKTGGGTRKDGKILKPVDWKAPDIRRIISEQIPDEQPSDQ